MRNQHRVGAGDDRAGGVQRQSDLGILQADDIVEYEPVRLGGQNVRLAKAGKLRIFGAGRDAHEAALELDRDRHRAGKCIGERKLAAARQGRGAGGQLKNHHGEKRYAAVQGQSHDFSLRDADRAERETTP